MTEALENGNEGSVNLATSTEQPKVDSVKSNQEKFAEKLASLRGKEPTKVEKTATTVESKQEEPTKVVETKDTKPVKESSSENKYKYTKDEGKIKGLERITREREKRIAELEKELAKFKQGNPKTRDQYESDLEFIEDLSAKKAEEITLNREYQREKHAKANDEREIYFEQVASQVKNPDVYHGRAQKYASDFDDVTNDYVFRSPVGFKMLDAIMEKFENTPGAREDFINMPLAKKLLLLVNLERIVTQPEVSNEPKSDEPKVSKAPSSIAPVKSEKVSEPVDIKSRFQQKLNQIRAGYAR